MKIIVTHSSNFHSDDLFAVATLITLFEQRGEIKSAKDYTIIRTTEPEKYKTDKNEFGRKADFILDIGWAYKPIKGLFDHHQEGGAGKRPNGVPYASFGLIWKRFGKELTGSIKGQDYVDRHIVQAVDAMDNGMYIYEPTIEGVHPFIVTEYIKATCDVAKGLDFKNISQSKEVTNKLYYKEFVRLIPFAKDVLRVYITKAKQKDAIAKVSKTAYTKAKDKRVIISDSFIPSSFEEYKAPKFVEPLVTVYPDLRGSWAAKVVTSGDQTFESRIKFPAAWRGKSPADLAKTTGIAGAKFCHNSGFLIAAETKEGILAMVKLAFEILKLKPFRV